MEKKFVRVKFHISHIVLCHLPMLAMITAGSLEGTCCNKGKISSMTNHLSKCGNNFPIQINPFTLTDSKVVCKINLLILGSNAVLMA